MPIGIYNRTEEHKQKISESLKMRWKERYFTEERNKRISKALTGRKLSEEHRRKIGLAQKGRKLSEEHKQKISNGNKGNKKLSESLKRYFREVGMSEETRKKLSLAQKGRKLSEEHKKKISKNHIGMLGKHCSEEHRRKIGLAHKGKIVSEETRKKLSLAHKGKIVSEETKKKQSAIKQDINIKDWKRFSREPYDQKWNNIFKRIIRKRDNYICMLCRIHQEKINRALDVHHINYDKTLTIKENCISLCQSCHMKTNVNRNHWIKFFQSLLFERYNYEYKNNLVVYNLILGNS